MMVILISQGSILYPDTFVEFIFANISGIPYKTFNKDLLSFYLLTGVDLSLIFSRICDQFQIIDRSGNQLSFGVSESLNKNSL